MHFIYMNISSSCKKVKSRGVFFNIENAQCASILITDERELFIMQLKLKNVLLLLTQLPISSECLTNVRILKI